MAELSVILADIRVFDPEFPVDRDRKPVQDPHHVCGVFLVHGSRLMPDHFFPQLFDELLHFGAGKLPWDHELIQVIGRSEKGLGRGKTEVFGKKDEIHHETVSEFTGHTHGMGHGIRKR